MEKKLPESIYIPKEFSPSSGVLSKAKVFIKEFKTFEIENGIPLLLLFDKRSKAFYLICHLESKLLSTKQKFLEHNACISSILNLFCLCKFNLAKIALAWGAGTI